MTAKVLLLAISTMISKKQTIVKVAEIMARNDIELGKRACLNN